MRWVVWGWFRCVLIFDLVYLKPVLPLPPQLLKLINFLKKTKIASLPMQKSAAKTKSSIICIFFWVFTSTLRTLYPDEIYILNVKTLDI